MKFVQAARMGWAITLGKSLAFFYQAKDAQPCAIKEGREHLRCLSKQRAPRLTPIAGEIIDGGLHGQTQLSHHLRLHALARDDEFCTQMKKNEGEEEVRIKNSTQLGVNEEWIRTGCTTSCLGHANHEFAGNRRSDSKREHS